MSRQKYKLNQEFHEHACSNFDKSVIELIGDKEFTIISMDGDNMPDIIEVDGEFLFNNGGEITKTYEFNITDIDSIIFTEDEFEKLIKVVPNTEKSYEELLDDLVEESKKLQKLIEGINERREDLEKAIELRKKITGK